MALETLTKKRGEWQRYYSSFFDREEKYGTWHDRTEYLAISTLVLNAILSCFLPGEEYLGIGTGMAWISLIIALVMTILNLLAKNARKWGEFGRRSSFWIGFSPPSALTSIAVEINLQLSGKELPNVNEDWYPTIPGISGTRDELVKDLLNNVLFTSKEMKVYQEKYLWKRSGLIFIVLISLVGAFSFSFTHISVSLMALIIQIVIVLGTLFTSEVFKVVLFLQSKTKVSKVRAKMVTFIEYNLENEQIIFESLRLHQEYSIALQLISWELSKIYNKYGKDIDQEVQEEVRELLLKSPFINQDIIT